MDFRDKVFISVAENLSFSKAGRELLVSQPAITKHIKELESRLDVSLFERKNNRVHLTQAGKITYTILKKIEKEYRILEQEINHINSSHRGEIIIGASSTIAQYVIPKAMASFHKKHPNIALHLKSGNSEEMEKQLLNDDIDLALVENLSSHADIKYQDFLDDELIIVTAQSSLYAKHKTISVNDLTNTPIVLRERGSGTLEVIKEALQRKEINLDELNTLIHLGSTESIKNFLLEFDGIAIVSEKAVTTELYMNELVRINLIDVLFDRKFRIGVKHGNDPYAVKLFKSHLANFEF